VENNQMLRNTCPFVPALLLALLAVLLPVDDVSAQAEPQNRVPGNVALTNGKWFDGQGFERKTMYSVDGRFSTRKPSRIDRTLDLNNAWIVPPFAEAHNHNIGENSEERQQQAIAKYLADGVFYVKIQGNFPLTNDDKRRLGINRPDSVDVIFANAGLTASGAHPIGLAESIVLPMHPELTRESLSGLRYFTVDSEQDLRAKWPQVLSSHPDFIKAFLLYSEEYAQRKDNPAYTSFNRGLDPALLRSIVSRAHADKLRVSVHVNTSADFHQALLADADEIAHLPETGLTPISVPDARLAARRGVVVISSVSTVPNLPPVFLSPTDKPKVIALQAGNLRLLHESGVRLVIGSDNVRDSSLQEFEYIRALGVFDNITLLKMWSVTTPQAIFPNRKIGAIKDGYEASFLALEGNPLDDLGNVRKIKMRFKQGLLLEASSK
jgi:imidazolonepropionase-like amidohydrolase